MRRTCRLIPMAAVVTLGLFLTVLSAQAQERMTIQATAQGTSTQMGRIQNIKIIIESFSTVEDQKALIEAFEKGGTDGIVEVLGKMKEKGRVTFPATTGNDLKYIKELPSDKGRHFRMVTDRNISIAEARNNPRSRDYSLSALDITITPDSKQSFGTFLPACKLYVNKKTKEIEIESLQNPWKLMNFIVSTNKEEGKKDEKEKK